MIEHCQVFAFTRASRERMSGMQVYHVDVCSAFLLKMLILFWEAPECFEYVPGLYGAESTHWHGKLENNCSLAAIGYWRLLNHDCLIAACVCYISLKVGVENDCTNVAPGQRVAVTLKTVPGYCGITWKGTYEAPGKNPEDVYNRSRSDVWSPKQQLMTVRY